MAAKRATNYLVSQRRGFRGPFFTASDITTYERGMAAGLLTEVASKL